jgi:hypothetical protein
VSDGHEENRISASYAELKFFVAAVAENRIGAVLAAAEVGDFGFCGLEYYRRESGALMAAVAEWLALAQAAGAPVVALSCFDLDSIGTLLRNGRFGHREFSLKVGRDIIA